MQKVDTRLDRTALLSKIWPWIFLTSLLIFFESWAQIRLGTSFLLNDISIQSVLLFTSVIMLLAIGQTFVIITSGIDLSVAFLMGLASVTMAQVTLHLGEQSNIAFILGIILAIGACLLLGILNGYLIAHAKVPAFIATLGMYGIARGAAFLTAGGGGTVSARHPVLDWLAQGWTPIILTAVLLFIMNFILSKTRFGQYTYAIGGNEQSASRAGINVKKHLVKIYMLSAGFSALGGILFTARFSGGAAIAGESMLLDSIAAVVIGGASLFGGTGNLKGTLIGALIIAVIQFGLVFLNVEAYLQYVAVGFVIILSALIDRYKDTLSRT